MNGTTSRELRLYRCAAAVAMAIATAVVSGCAAVGPSTIEPDRHAYTLSVGESWKRQMLLNIVKIRYGDAPIFLEVASIINQYALETEINGRLGWSFPPAHNDQAIGGIGRYADRPTISYNLMSGEKFARSMMSPVPPAVVMGMVESGYSADTVFRVLVKSVNGVRSQMSLYNRSIPADPQYYPLLDLLRGLQESGAFSIRLKTRESGEVLLLVLGNPKTQAFEEDIRKVRQILGLKEGVDQYSVVYGSATVGDEEIALLTRSLLEVLTDIAASVEVPPEDVAEGRVGVTMESTSPGYRAPLVHIAYSGEEPEDAFAAAPYRDGWFWISDRDFPSKKIFSFLMFLMTLTESGGKQGAPVMTISTGG